MIYLTLDKQEIKELIRLRVIDFFKYLGILVVLSFLSHEILHVFFPRIVYTEQFFLVALLVLLYSGYIFHSNRLYLYEIISRKKLVYKGVLSSKTVSRLPSEGKYYFNMDGKIFSVGKEIFSEFEEGDFLEFHVSPSTKHLFKVASCN
jgi:hypothetical protein